MVMFRIHFAAREKRKFLFIIFSYKQKNIFASLTYLIDKNNLIEIYEIKIIYRKLYMRDILIKILDKLSSFSLLVLACKFAPR